jgi:hypothetical protein
MERIQNEIPDQIASSCFQGTVGILHVCAQRINVFVELFLLNRFLFHKYDKYF